MKNTTANIKFAETVMITLQTLTMAGGLIKLLIHCSINHDHFNRHHQANPYMHTHTNTRIDHYHARVIQRRWATEMRLCNRKWVLQCHKTGTIFFTLAFLWIVHAGAVRISAWNHKAIKIWLIFRGKNAQNIFAFIWRMNHINFHLRLFYDVKYK